MWTKEARCQNKSNTHTHTQEQGYKKCTGPLCRAVSVCIWARVPGGKAVHVARTGADQRRRIILGMCAPSKTHPSPPSTFTGPPWCNKIRTSRSVISGWCGRTRAGNGFGNLLQHSVTFPCTPALTNKTHHGSVGPPPFCSPFLYAPSHKCLTCAGKMWVELSTAAAAVDVVVVPLSTHANLNKLTSGWVNARICLRAVGGLMGSCVCVCVWEKENYLMLYMKLHDIS